MDNFLKLYKNYDEYDSVVNKPTWGHCIDDIEMYYGMAEHFNVITYTATSKLVETTSSKETGLHTNAFNTTIVSHTFEDGIGTIEFADDVTSIGSIAFSGCSGLISIIIPNSVTSIGDSAFDNCRGLVSINIPSGVTSIGNQAFSNCRSLTSVTIPNSVTSIGQSAFNGCSGLTSIDIPNSVTSIGSSAFQNCTSLTSIELPNRITIINGWTFDGCSNLTSIKIPNNVEEIWYCAFRDCVNLEKVDIPSGVTTVMDSSFSGCSSVTTVFVDSETLISQSGSFLNQFTNLRDLTIGDNVTYAYMETPYLTACTIGNNINKIEGHFLSVCSNCVLTCKPITPPQLLGHPFSGTSGVKVYVLAQSLETYRNQWAVYSSYIDSIEPIQ